MSHLSRRRVASFILAVALLAGPAPHVFAQAVQVAPGTIVVPAQSAAATPPGIDPRQADELRDEFRELMRQYPPSLAQILRLDSALMVDSDYMAPYPALAAYLRAHPEITRHPDFFLNFANQNGWWSDPGSPDVQLRRDAINFQRSVMQNFTIVGAIAAVVLGILWLARLFICHRRWIRATRLQSELNNRLLGDWRSGIDGHAFHDGRFRGNWTGSRRHRRCRPHRDPGRRTARRGRGDGAVPDHGPSGRRPVRAGGSTD